MVNSTTIKFLISYGGRIQLRKPDGKLRYVGGFTRVLAAERSLSYAELMAKLVELCGTPATISCQLPEGDLDTLITIRSDEELASVLEEYYDGAPSSSQKIRAILTPLKSPVEQVSPPESTVSSAGSFHSEPLPPNRRLPRPHSADDLYRSTARLPWS